MKKAIGDLTLREVTEMKCNPEGCSKCPFNTNDSMDLAWDICDLVNRNNDNCILDQEIEMEE